MRTYTMDIVFKTLEDVQFMLEQVCAIALEDDDGSWSKEKRAKLCYEQLEKMEQTPLVKNIMAQMRRDN